MLKTLCKTDAHFETEGSSIFYFNNAYVVVGFDVRAVFYDGYEPQKTFSTRTARNFINFDDESFDGFDFDLFLKNLCTKDGEFDKSTYDKLIQATGCLMHRHNNPETVVVLIDEAFNYQGLHIVRALSEIRPLELYTGSGHRFKLNTNIVWINDPSLVNDIPEIYNIFDLLKRPRPKIIISSTKPLKLEQNQIDVRLHSYYSEAFTPEMEFGRSFFNDWDERDWEKFNNLMIWACWNYFDTANVKYRLLLRLNLLPENEAEYNLQHENC